MRKVIALSLILALPGCALFRPQRQVYEPPHQPQIKESLLGECSKPVEIPDRDLTQEEEHALWGKDRRALGNCGFSKHALNKAVRIQQGHTK